MGGSSSGSVGSGAAASSGLGAPVPSVVACCATSPVASTTSFATVCGTGAAAGRFWQATSAPIKRGGMILNVLCNWKLRRLEAPGASNNAQTTRLGLRYQKRSARAEVDNICILSILGTSIEGKREHGLTRRCENLGLGRCFLRSAPVVTPPFPIGVSRRGRALGDVACRAPREGLASSRWQQHG